MPNNELIDRMIRAVWDGEITDGDRKDMKAAARVLLTDIKRIRDKNRAFYLEGYAEGIGVGLDNEPIPPSEDLRTLMKAAMDEAIARTSSMRLCGSSIDAAVEAVARVVLEKMQEPVRFSSRPSDMDHHARIAEFARTELGIDLEKPDER